MKMMTTTQALSNLKQATADLESQTTKDGILLFSYHGSEPHTVSFEAELNKLIWPTREGELIEDISKLPTDQSYKLSYPGTASTKSMVLYLSDNSGLFLLSKPSLAYAQLTIQRLKDNTCRITINIPGAA